MAVCVQAELEARPGHQTGEQKGRAALRLPVRERHVAVGCAYLFIYLILGCMRTRPQPSATLPEPGRVLTTLPLAGSMPPSRGCAHVLTTQDGCHSHRARGRAARCAATNIATSGCVQGYHTRAPDAVPPHSRVRAISPDLALMEQRARLHGRKLARPARNPARPRTEPVTELTMGVADGYSYRL